MCFIIIIILQLVILCCPTKISKLYIYQLHLYYILDGFVPEHRFKILSPVPVAGVIPKSTTPAHIQSNLEVTSFCLSDQQMAALTSLDRQHHYCWDPASVLWGEPVWPADGSTYLPWPPASLLLGPSFSSVRGTSLTSRWQHLPPLTASITTAGTQLRFCEGNLSDHQMAALTSLDRQHHYCWDPASVLWREPVTTAGTQLWFCEGNLSDQQMAALTSLDRQHHYCWDPASVLWGEPVWPADGSTYLPWPPASLLLGSSFSSVRGTCLTSRWQHLPPLIASITTARTQLQSCEQTALCKKTYFWSSVILERYAVIHHGTF